MRVPEFTAEAALGVRGPYTGQHRRGDSGKSLLVAQTAPGFYYAGQSCQDHVIWETWTEINGGPPIYHDWPVGSC